MTDARLRASERDALASGRLDRRALAQRIRSGWVGRVPVTCPACGGERERHVDRHGGEAPLPGPRVHGRVAIRTWACTHCEGRGVKDVARPVPVPSHYRPGRGWVYADLPRAIEIAAWAGDPASQDLVEPLWSDRVRAAWTWAEINADDDLAPWVEHVSGRYPLALSPVALGASRAALAETMPPRPTAEWLAAHRATKAYADYLREPTAERREAWHRAHEVAGTRAWLTHSQGNDRVRPQEILAAVDLAGAPAVRAEIQRVVVPWALEGRVP